MHEVYDMLRDTRVSLRLWVVGRAALRRVSNKIRPAALGVPRQSG